MHGFFLREMMRSFRHHRGVGITAILSLTAALTLSGLFLLLSWNAHTAIVQVGDRREMVVYLNDDVTATQRDVLTGRIHDLYGEVTYVDKDQAWKEFVAQVGDATLLESVGDNPLPASMRIKLKPELLNPASMELTAKQISAFPEVEDVRYGAEWVRRLDAITHMLLIVTISVLAMVGIAIMLIVYTTMRFSVVTRRQQVEIMSRLGATDRFVAIPFLLEALFEALIASAVALGLLFGAQQLLAAQVLNGIEFLPWGGALAFVGGVLLLAMMSAMLALSRMLRSPGA